MIPRPRASSPTWRQAIVVARGWDLHLAVAVIAAVAAVGLLAPDLIVLPALTSRAVALTPTGAMAAVAAGVGVLLAAREPLDVIPSTSPRHLVLWRGGRVLALTALAVAAVSLPWPSLFPACLTAATAAVGEGLLLARLAGPALAWALPVLHVTAATFFGYQSDGTLRPWAWLLSVDPGTAHITASLGLLTTGVVIWASGPPRV